MNTLTANRWIQPVVLGIIVLLTRFPFIGAGYGSEPDAWRIVNVARVIATEGTYVTSRLPGFPVQEFTCSMLWDAGPTVLNGLTALLSSVAAVFFFLILRKYNAKGAFLGTLALALTPAIFINSTCLKDYIWALTLVLGSYYYVLCGRPLTSGVLLGLATGCRLTSMAMIVPLGYLLIMNSPASDRRKTVLRFTLAAVIIAVLLYLPVMLKYGWPVPRFQGELQYPAISVVIRKAIDALGGRTGLLAFLLGAVVHFAQKRDQRRSTSISSEIGKRHIAMWGVTVLGYVTLYLILPHQSGYLIPILPFVFLLCARFFNRKAFLAFCAITLLSPFLSFGRSGVYGGPIFDDRTLRLRGMEYVANVIGKGETLEDGSVVVAGWWLPQIETNLGKGNKRIQYVYVLEKDQFEQLLRTGRKIFYLPEIDAYNLRVTGVDLHQADATELLGGAP